MVRKIIVIGAGAAGMTAASAAKRTDPRAAVTVFTEDEHIAYSPCVIPWVLEGRTTWNDIVMHDASYYSEERGITVHTMTKVTAVDGNTKKVTAGGRTYDYDTLVIATGGAVFRPPVPGVGLKNVFVVRTINDGKKIQNAMKDCNRVVIAGAGVIGLEMALSVRKGGKDVTAIEMFDQIMPRIADKDMAEPVQKHLERFGIKFVLSSPIQSIEGGDTVRWVTASGKRYECDMVILATGVRANLEVPKMLGLDIGKLGAVVVSPSMRPYRNGVLVDDIFVAGDVVQCESAIASGPTMSQLGSSAVKQGLVAGKNAAGDRASSGAVASPWVSVIGDLHIAGTGLSENLAAWYNIRTVSGRAEGFTRARYYPDHKEMIVKIMADADTHAMIGAQIVAGEDATGRINWLTDAIINGTKAEDFLERAENAYCPPTSMVRDVVISAAENLCNNLNR
ncbi:MAG: FAD-dependent oxidoreductase [Methanomassiliicoccaceae archaeon]|jgi:NADH oxidase (H2O2-forming)|nr:FAD-dependent oxidoreductase [Methanomassiliicoccaceae archaeon]